MVNSSCMFQSANANLFSVSLGATERRCTVGCGIGNTTGSGQLDGTVTPSQPRGRLLPSPMRTLASAIEINACWSKMEGVAIGRHFGKMAHHELGPKANYADGSPPRLPSYYQGNLGVRSRNCGSTRRLAARLHPAHVRVADD